ncbi:MAG TPA: putative Ig domain-containing protein, partial [Nitrospira sp.]
VVEVIPMDPFTKGKVFRSDAIAIDNSPPKIMSTPSTPNTVDRYEYAVQAIDPDGDRLSFTLKAAPTGMTIDHISGLLIWRIVPGTSGTHSAKIVVEDGQGGSTVQEINLTLPTPISS